MYVFKALREFFDVILPEYCLGCRARGTLVCEKCLSLATLARLQVENPHIFSVFDYHDPLIKKALWQLKYKNKKSLAKIFGKAMYENLMEDISDLKVFSPGKPLIIVPIPLYRKRLKERGYNQSLLLAQSLTENTPLGLFEINNNLVWKIKETPPQAHIANRQKRLSNIQGAFALSNFPESDVRGRTIIILDDISTTGGTINEVRKILKKSGAKKVVGFSVAH